MESKTFFCIIDTPHPEKEVNKCYYYHAAMKCMLTQIAENRYNLANNQNSEYNILWGKKEELKFIW